MGNNTGEIDLIAGQEAFNQVDKLIKLLNVADAGMVRLSESALAVNKNLTSISTPKGLNDQVISNQKLSQELESQSQTIAKLQAQIQQLARAKQLATTQNTVFSKSVSTTNQATRESAVANQIARAETDRNFRANTLLAGAYARASAQLLILKKEAKDAAIAYGENSKQAISAAKAASEMNERLKSADKSVGDFQRNVGNYSGGIAGGFQKIFSSVRQLAYILPGIGIAGIFGLAFEAITPLVEKVKNYVLGITEASKAQEEFNREISNTKNAISSESTQLQSLTAIVNNHNESSQNRKLAYDEIKKTLPGLTSATYEEAIATGELTRATDLYILSLVQKNIVEAEAKLIAEEQTKLNKETSKSYTEHIGKVEAFLQSLQPERQRKNIEKAMKAQIKAEEDAQQTIINNRQKALVKAQEDYLKTQSALKPFVTPPEKEKKAKKEDPTPKVRELESSLKSVGTIISQINEEISRLTTEKILADESALPTINFQLEQLVKLKEQIQGLPETDLKIINTTVKSKEAIKQLSEQMKAFLGSFTAEFFDKSGFSESFKILNGEIEGFGENWQVTTVAIMESAQEMFNFISSYSQTNFEAERERLDRQKEISIANAGDSAEAKKKIEQDYEQNKIEIANREAKAKKRLTMFEIAMDTAQAIVAALPNIPLSIAVGALGAVQLALVASKEVPKYWKGTQNHIGGAMLVNDGVGSNFQETIVTPDNKIYQPMERNVLMNAPKGTKVFTHSQWKEQLDNMIFSNDISWHNQNGSNINKTDLQNLGSGIVSAIQNKKEFSLSIDKKGFNTSIIDGNIRRTILNNEINSKGIFT